MIHFTVSDLMPVLAVTDVGNVNTHNISFNSVKNNLDLCLENLQHLMAFYNLPKHVKAYIQYFKSRSRVI